MEKWKDKIMNSLEGMERAKPSQDVFKRIQVGIQTKKGEGKQWIAIAATVSLMICANVYFLVEYDSKNPITENGGEYQSVVSNYNIYDNE